MRMARPRAYENLRSSINRSAVGRTAQSLTSKSSLRLTREAAGVPPISEGAVIAGRVEPALGKGDQRAGERHAFRHEDQTFDALVAREAS